MRSHYSGSGLRAVVATIVFWSSFCPTGYTRPGTALPPEIFFDQPYYVAGDTARFSFYSPGSLAVGDLFHVYLFNSSGSAVSHTILIVSSYCTPGQLILDRDMRPGMYYIGGYPQSPASGLPSITSAFWIAGENLAAADAHGSVDDLWRDSSIVTLSGLDRIYRVRDSIRISLGLRDELSAAIASVRVYKKDLFQQQVPYNAPSTASLRHERLRGNKIQLIGTVRDITGTPVPDSSLVILFLSGSLMTYEIYTGPEGRIDMQFFQNFPGSEKIYYEVSYKGKWLPSAAIQIESPHLDFSTAPVVYTGLRDEYFTYSQAVRTVRAVYSFDRARTGRTDAFVRMLEEEIMGADVAVAFDEYHEFETMAEVFKEIIPFVSHRVKAGKSALRIYFNELGTTKGRDPLYIIDGILCNDTDYVMGLDPKVIENVKVVKSLPKLNRLGAIADYGILIINTLGTDATGHLSHEKEFVEVTGLSVMDERNNAFHFPESIPDFRQVLAWYPRLELQPGSRHHLTFTTSDDCGEYRLEVFGVRGDGRTFRHQQDFNVEFHR